MAHVIRASVPIFTLFLSLIVAMGCSENKGDRYPKGSVSVQIPYFDKSSNDYRLEVVELFSIQDLLELKGLAAKIMVYTQVISDRLTGAAPTIKTIRDSNGVYIPTDSLSLQMMALYAHMEKLMDLDQSLGIKELNKWPRPVAVNVQYQASAGAMENNALYVSKYDAILIVPYTAQKLPLMVNAGVLGHEHFHSIFQRTIIDPMGQQFPLRQNPTVHPEPKILSQFGVAEEGEVAAQGLSEKEIYDAMLLRGLNEGLADIWGWIYSGDNNFVGRSLSIDANSRKLDVGMRGVILSKLTLKNMMNQLGDKYYVYLSYQLGAQMAKSMRTFAQIYQEGRGLTLKETQMQIAQLVIKSLPILKERALKLSKEESLNPSSYLDILASQIEGAKKEECEFLSQITPIEEKTSLKSSCIKGGTP